MSSPTHPRADAGRGEETCHCQSTQRVVHAPFPAPKRLQVEFTRADAPSHLRPWKRPLRAARTGAANTGARGRRGQRWLSPVSPVRGSPCRVSRGSFGAEALTSLADGLHGTATQPRAVAAPSQSLKGELGCLFLQRVRVKLCPGRREGGAGGEVLPQDPRVRAQPLHPPPRGLGLGPRLPLHHACGGTRTVRDTARPSCGRQPQGQPQESMDCPRSPGACVPVMVPWVDGAAG